MHENASLHNIKYHGKANRTDRQLHEINNNRFGKRNIDISRRCKMGVLLIDNDVL